MNTVETKPSLKTSEFWIHAALQIFMLLNTLNVWNYVPAKYAGLLQTILAGAYMISRGQSKSGTPYDPVPTPASDTTDSQTQILTQ